MKVSTKDAGVAILLISLGAIALQCGESLFGWTDLIRGNIFAFFVAITVLYTSMSYDKWQRKKQIEDKRIGILKGIYQEVLERARYLKNYANTCFKEKQPYIICMNEYSSSAWQSAIHEGYFDPEDQFWTDCEFVYQSTRQLNYEMDRAHVMFFQSTLEKEFIQEQLYAMSTNWIKSIEKTLIIIDCIILHIEKKLGISHNQMLKLNAEISVRIDKTIEDRQSLVEQFHIGAPRQPNT